MKYKYDMYEAHQMSWIAVTSLETITLAKCSKYFPALPLILLFWYPLHDGSAFFVHMLAI